jgi:hypothetical protein
VAASDGSGNDATATRSYRVVYPFSGFFSPLAAAPAFAPLKAGDKVPVKFSLGGSYGLDVLESATWTPADCGSGAPRADSSVAAGRLSYNGDRYHYVVETSASWRGCWQLAVTLDDGAIHHANVQFS